jgi:murein DD-endopeptidase MepM/ murein hydrolase activator NlpD
MYKQGLTILIIPEGKAKVRKIILCPFLSRIIFISLGVAFLIYGFFIYASLSSRMKLVEVRKLRVETSSQQAEIRHFAQKIALMEEQSKKLLEMEGQVKKELEEINHQMKSATKTSTAMSIDEPHLIGKAGISFSGEQIYINDNARPPLISHLDRELVILRKQSIQREHNLGEIGKFLQAQKSVLTATPSLWPVKGRITSSFGETRQVLASGGTRPHMGVDIASPVGTAILAPADGVVKFTGWGPRYGRCISIDHGHGFCTMYGHLKEFLVKAGARVKRGQSIGKVGLTGQTNGPHLHYVIYFHGSPVNPIRFLTQTQ